MRRGRVMSKITDKRQIRKLTILFTVVYMVSYITRINYGAVIAGMENALGITKDLLSLALTGSFITYGAGQIISGVCGDKLPPKLLISCGFITTIFMNLLIPLCQNPYAMAVIWSINGFAQAFMWPPLIRIMTHLFSGDDYSDAVVSVNGGGSYGTIAIYIVASVLVAIISWKAVFVFSALCGIIMLILWNKFCPDVRPAKKEKMVVKSGKTGNKLLFAPIMLLIMLAIIMQGSLRDGITTWMPSYINETYNLGEAVSILTGAVLPLFALGCMWVAAKLNNKKFANPVMCAGVIFGAGTIASLGLLFATGRNAVLSITCMAILSGAMHGVNLMLVSMVPAAFKKYGNVSTASGVINSCTYIGSAISTYGIALISQNFGWTFTLKIWFAIAIVGTTICLICARPWEKTHME